MDNFKINSAPLYNIFHRVEPNQTMDDICKIYKVNATYILEHNKVSVLEAGDVLFIPKSNSISYIVKPADTLETIARTFNVSAEKIKENNNVKNLFVGQKLFF